MFFVLKLSDECKRFRSFTLLFLSFNVIKSYMFYCKRVLIKNKHCLLIEIFIMHNLTNEAFRHLVSWIY